MTKRLITSLLSLSVLLLSLLPGVVQAAPKPSQAPAGLTVAPFLQAISVASFETSKTFSVAVTNQTTSRRLLKVSGADFGSLNDTGGLAFVGESSPTAQQHGLKNWLQLDQTQLTLAPGQTVRVSGTVTVDKAFAPGGHYGAILFNQVDNFRDKSSAVAASPTVSALVFVDKLGGETHDLHLSAVAVDRSWWQLPDSVTLHFQNPANTEVVPRGVVTVERHGQIVRRGIINEDSAIVLPGSYRRLPLNLFATSGSWWPGKYLLTIDYRYDGVAQTAHHQEAIWVLPWQFMLFVLLVLVMAAAVWHWRVKLHKIVVFHR